MPITYIAIGAVYLEDCPVQKMIPIYLIVAGVFCIIFNLLACLPCFEYPKGCVQSLFSKLFASWSSTVFMFLFCWFIAGNYWIYSVFEPSYNKNGTDVSRYCNKTLYLFSFWTTTILYILLGFVLVIGCCCCFCGFFLWLNEEPNKEAEDPEKESAEDVQESITLA